MSQQPLRIGLVGANASRGWARDAHLPALRNLPGYAITAVSARNMAIAEEAKAAFGAQAAHDDSLALARDPDVDVVVVCVKVPEHRAVVLAALDAGKPVYCEWPLGRDTAEAIELADAATARGVPVMVGLQGASADAVRQAGRQVADGAVGKAQTLTMVSPTGGWGPVTLEHYTYLEDARNGATLLSIPGGHSMAAIEAIVGRYEEVGATGSIFHPQIQVADGGRSLSRTSSDHLVIVGRHAGGCVSILEIVGGTMTVPFRLDLRGSSGTLAITGGHPGGFQAGVLSLSDAPPASSSLSGPAANVAALYSRFAADLRDGTRSVPDFNHAVRLHRLLDAVGEAAGTGRRIAVKG